MLWLELGYVTFYWVSTGAEVMFRWWWWRLFGAQRKQAPSDSDTDSSSPAKKSKHSPTTTPPGNRPLCKYGATCYQKNPDHRRNFHHPPANEGRSQGGGGKETGGTTSKVATPVKVVSAGVSSRGFLFFNLYRFHFIFQL